MMAAIWAKIDALLPMNPKCFAAGFFATTIYSHLLLLNKAHGRRGKLGAAMASPTYLVRYLQIDREMEPAEAFQRVQEALRACVREGLIALENDGVRILGWNGVWSETLTSTERTRKWRESQRDESGTGETPGTDGDERDKRDKRDVGTSRSDQIRVEEKRIEESSQGANAEGVSEDTPKTKAIPKTGKGSRTPDPDKIPERAHLAAQVLADYVTETNPDGTLAKMAPAKRQAAILKSADEIRKANSADGHSWSKIDGMIEFAQRDRFWAPLVLDGKRLRKHWDTMAGQRSQAQRGGNGKDVVSADEIAQMAVEAQAREAQQ
jgi:hypothetical protein